MTTNLSVQSEGHIIPTIAGGRLTGSSSDPIGETSGGNQLYYLPYVGRNIALYDGLKWYYFDIGSGAQINVTDNTDDNTNNDVFLYNDSDSLTIELVEWTDDTTRATAIVQQDGVWVKSGSPTYRYAGTIRATLGGNIANWNRARGIFNANNRIRQRLKRNEISNSSPWIRSLDSYWVAANHASNRVDLVIGLDENDVEITAIGRASHSSGKNTCAIGISIINFGGSYSTQDANIYQGSASNVANVIVKADYIGRPGIGYYEFYWVNAATESGDTTWYGNKSSFFDETFSLSGLIGTVWG